MKKILLVSLMVLSMTVLTACGNRNAMDNGDNGTGITNDTGTNGAGTTDNGTTGTGMNDNGTTGTGTNGNGTTGTGMNDNGTTGTGMNGNGTTGTGVTGTDDLNNTDNVNDVTAGDYNGTGSNGSIAGSVGDAIDDAGNAASDIIDDAATGVENMVDDVTGNSSTNTTKNR